MGRASTPPFPGRRFFLLWRSKILYNTWQKGSSPFPYGPKECDTLSSVEDGPFLPSCPVQRHTKLEFKRRKGKERAPRPYFHRATKGEVRAKEKVRVTRCTGEKEKGFQRMKLCRMFHIFRSLEGTEHQKGGKAFLLSLSFFRI